MQKAMTSKRLIIRTLAGLFLAALPLTAWAASQQFEQSVYVGPDQIISGNFVKASNVIDIHGPVNGDVIVAGSSITIAGAVAGDVIAVGNNITITGPVSGSVRVAGSTVQINSHVDHNVWAAGSTVTLGSESTVGWDTYAAGGSVEVRGPIGGNLWVGGGTVIAASTIGKDLIATVDQGGQVILYPTAAVKGNLSYRAVSDKQLVIKEGATVAGEKKLLPLPNGKRDVKNFFSAAYFFWKIVGLFSLLVIGIIIVTLAPKKLLEVQTEMMKRPWPSLGWGLIYLIITPVAALLLLVTIIGIPLALIMLALYAIALCASKVFAGFALGSLILNKLAKVSYKGSLIWPLILGLVIIVFLSAVPLIGWAFKLLLVLWAFGALMTIRKQTLKEFR